MFAKYLFVGYTVLYILFSLNSRSSFLSFHHQDLNVVYSSSHLFFAFYFMFVTYAPVSTSSGLFFIRKCFVGFILSSTALCPVSPWFFHRKPFVLSKQALICASHSKLQQGCQVSIPTPGRSSCSSGPEQQAGAVCAVLLPYGPLVQQARGRSHERKCLLCWLEVLKAAAC